MATKRNDLLTLVAYEDDSDSETDTETATKGGLVSAAYGDDDISRMEQADELGEEDESSSPLEGEDSETELLEADGLKDILDEKIQKLYDRKLSEGLDMNNIIQRKKEFRNPSIYEKLIQFCGIVEHGTNYPKDMFDPHGWSEDSYYEALAKAQKIEMDKIEKVKKERAKIEFVTRTKTGTNTSSGTATTTTASTTVADSQKRKRKWDSAVPATTIAQPTIITTTATLPGVVTVTTSASGAKTTVISAVGTIVKKSKQ
ncbi:SAP30-binding protein-like [Cetorhinus maximus]